MQHLQARQVTKLDDLLGNRKSARDQRLRGNHGGHGGQADQRNQKPVRRHIEEGILDGFRVGQQQGALAEIVERQAGHDDREPGQADRLFAKVAHVGIQCLAPRHAQDHGTQDDEGGAGLVPDKAQGVGRADGPQNGGVLHDVDHTQNGNTQEPDHRDGAKELANAGGAALLHRKQAKQNHQGERDHILLEGRGNHLQALHRRQHRDRRGNHPIAIKQASAKHADQQQHAAQFRPVFDRLGGQGQHGHQAAFAMVVGAQHQHHVLDGNDDRQGPKEDGEDAVDIGFGKRHVAGPENFLHGIQHAGADIPVNHTDGAQGKRR